MQKKIEPIFKEKKAIVFASDNDYIKYFAVALQSLIQNSNSNENYDIILLASDTDEKNKYHLKKMLPSNFSLRYFDIESYIKNNYTLKLSAFSYWSISMWYRIFIPLLMPNYERVLYLDSDVCINKSIDELFKISFDDKALLVVRDTTSVIIHHKVIRIKHMTEELKLKNPENYFNSGVLLFNIKKINKDNYIKQCWDIIENTNLKFPDQDLLNIIFENRCKFLPLQFNLQWHFMIYKKTEFDLGDDNIKKMYLKGFDNPSIIHYTTSKKPWSNPLEKQAEIWWHYARQTPFYEEILLNIWQNNSIASNVNKEIIKHISNRLTYRLKYLKYKLLKPFTFGKLHKKYKEKKKKYKQLLKQIKNYLK